MVRRYKEGEWMIECEACNDWFHGHCVGVDEQQVCLISRMCSLTNVFAC
jgi:hypothetical protein